MCGIILARNHLDEGPLWCPFNCTISWRGINRAALKGHIQRKPTNRKPTTTTTTTSWHNVKVSESSTVWRKRWYLHTNTFFSTFWLRKDFLLGKVHFQTLLWLITLSCYHLRYFWMWILGQISGHFMISESKYLALSWTHSFLAIFCLISPSSSSSSSSTSSWNWSSSSSSRASVHY